MGRGRAKAKQTKVARDLKYRTHQTDFGELARELHGGETTQAPGEPVDTVDATGDASGGGDEYNEWADYSGSNGDTGREPSREPSRRD